MKKSKEGGLRGGYREGRSYSLGHQVGKFQELQLEALRQPAVEVLQAFDADPLRSVVRQGAV